MTIVIAASLGTPDIFLLGDTVATYQGYQDPKWRKVTSQYEKLDIPNHNQHFFAENACKIGILGDNVGVAISGEVNLAISILDTIFYSFDEKWTTKQILERIESARISFGGEHRKKERSAGLMFVVHDQTATVITADITLKQDGTCLVDVGHKIINGHYGQCSGGSGKKFLFDGFRPNIVRDLITREPSRIDIADSVLALEYGLRIRNLNENKANGVGGSFLGLRLSPGEIRYQKETISIAVDENSELKYACKTAYRDDYFFIIDYIGMHITVIPTIEHQLKLNKGLMKNDIDKAKNLAKDVYEMQADVVLFHHFDNSIEDIKILNGIGTFESEGFPVHFEPGFYSESVIEMSMDKGILSFKVTPIKDL